jgi:hypothetical protein
MLAILVAITQVSVAALGQGAVRPTSGPASGQGTVRPGAKPQTPHTANSTSAPSQSAGGQGASTDCNGFPCDDQQQQPPHFIVTLPPAAPTPWLWRDRVTWGANLVVAILGYVGIMVALSTLKKIERQSRSVEAAAAAASASAEAALLNAQSILEAGRPWILITVKPSAEVENTFAIMATNRGNSPARIVGTAEETRFAIDEARLPRTPIYASDDLNVPLVPIILLPGESAEIKPFSRDEVRAICDSDERLRRIEDWEEKLYLYGKVVYQDLIAASDRQTHETAWCCWYIHGRQKSGLVFAGPAEYNGHT